MKRKRKLRFNLTIKLVMVFTIAFVLPGMMLLHWLSNESQKNAKDEATEYLMSNVKSTALSFDEILRNADFIHTQAASDDEFMELNKKLLPTKERNSYAEHSVQSGIINYLSKYYIGNNYVSSLYLYNPYADIMYLYSIDYSKKGILDEYSKLDSSNAYIDWLKQWVIQPSLEDPTRKQFSSISRANIFYDKKNPMYFSVNVDFSLLENRLTETFAGNNIGLYVEDLKGDRISFKTLEANDEAVQQLIPTDTDVAFFKEKGEEYIAVRNNASYSDLIYTAYAPISSISHASETIAKFRVFYLGSLLMIFILLILFLGFFVIKPIKLLYKGLKMVAGENLEVQLPEKKSSDEMAFILKAFNQMVTNLRKLIFENYQNQLLKQEFELKYIQTQINEHFLYNTIDCIQWTAKKHGVPEISEMILALSKYFRLTLSNGQDFVTPKQIQELFEQYMFLINARSDDLISITFHSDKELDQERFLKYLFQPLIENAVVHGLKQGRNGNRMEVSLRLLDNQRILFQVVDNGEGIRPDRLEEIRHKIEINEKRVFQQNIEQEEFFALENVNQQIYLYYGIRNSIRLESEPYERTCVSFEITREKEKHV